MTGVRAERWTEDQVAEIRARLGGRGTMEVLTWALDTLSPAIALGTGLGVEGMIVLDHLARLERIPRVFLLDTGRLPQETHDLLDRARARYRIEIEVFSPDPADVEPMIREHGSNLFYNSVELRQLCCRVRKVVPLQRALQGLEGWITGQRRGQGLTRSSVGTVELDRDNGSILKINPLADWSYQQVWAYVRAHQVPYNALHDQGYTSIGCAPCSRAVQPGEDERAGRWWWERPENRECGIHGNKGGAA